MSAQVAHEVRNPRSPLGLQNRNGAGIVRVPESSPVERCALAVDSSAVDRLGNITTITSPPRLLRKAGIGGFGRGERAGHLPSALKLGEFGSIENTEGAPFSGIGADRAGRGNWCERAQALRGRRNQRLSALDGDR